MLAASARSTQRSVRALIRTAAATAALVTLSSVGAFAQSCNDDIGAMQTKRNGHLAALNKITKANGGKLDPVAACPRLRNLAAVEREMLGYMQKNQSWCTIPEEIIEQVKTGANRTSQIAGQACKIAAQARQMQNQQSSAGPAAPTLPRGPL